MGLGQGARRDHLTMADRPIRDAAWALRAYEAARHRLPSARFTREPVAIGGLSEIAGRYDAFLLDAFGVLNVGETAIPGAAEAVAAVQGQGKQVLVLTNGATLPPEAALAKYRRLGFDFGPEDVISSREALQIALAGRPQRLWGTMATKASKLELLGVRTSLLMEDPADYAACDGFILLGSGRWTEERQALLLDALRAKPRPVLVGNPDIVAPREDGLSLEPGHYAHRLADAGVAEPEFFGKPFANIYSLALARLTGIARDRILMVGDTLHTDVLGGAQAGVNTLLLTDNGLFAGQDVMQAIRSTGVRPTWIAPAL